MTALSTAEHVAPRCVKLTFTGPMRNNADFRDPQYYSVNGGVTVEHVEPQYAQSAPFVSSPSQLGGVPVAAYLLLDQNPNDAGSTIAGLSASGLTTLLDFDGLNLTAPQTVSLTTKTQQDISYWTGDGIRTKETFNELSRVGRAKWTTAQPLNYSTAQMIGKLNDLMSGGLRAVLDTDIEGPANPMIVPTFSAGGFASSPIPIPDIGLTISFRNNIIPCHVDKLWGVSDGSNRLFRASTTYHPHSCVLIAAEGDSDSVDQGIVDDSRWYAPNEGFDRQVIMKEAPPAGATIIAVYVPRRSLIAVGHEIIAYEESDIDNGTAVIYGRNQLMSSLEAHSSGDVIEDVWGTSFVKKAEYNILAMGGSGRALEYIGMDSGCPRSDNPTLNDTNLRRMIYHTAVTMRGTPETAREGIRYIYPRLWPNIIVGEDPRWPGCIVIWVNEDTIIGDMNWITSPNVELWETWLDELSWPDGMPTELINETYYRDDGVDSAEYGDYFLADFTEDPEVWPYPIVISGNLSYLLGEIAPVIPDPASVSSAYRSYLQRPDGLNKVLPNGCGVLLLDTSLL